MTLSTTRRVDIKIVPRLFTALQAAMLVLAMASEPAFAATITVNPGQTVQSGINAAAAGDTVIVNAGNYTSGIMLNKSVTVQANGVVTLAPTTPGTGIGLDIECSNCGVVGIRFVDWGGLDWDYGRNHSNVTLKNCLFRRSGFWGIDGANWLIEGNEFDRPMRDADNTISLFGTGHVFRRNYFHGWVIPTDVMGGQHMDHIQFWNNNGEILRDILIEENIFTDYVQVLFIANERATTGPDQPRNITVRNNVFWGTDLTPGPDNLDRPSHTVFMGKGWGTTLGGVANAVITNNIMRYGANQVTLYGMPSSTIVQGNIISEGGADYTLGEGTTGADRGTIGNISWQAAWHPLGQGPDKFIDPQYKNKNAVGSAVVGPDGIPFTTDDAWIPMNAAAAGYGPQMILSGGGTPTTTVTANNDSFSAISEDSAATLLNVLSNDTVSPSGTLSISAIGTPSKGATVSISGTSISYRPAANASGAETFTYTAREAGGATGTATVTVNITEVNDPPTVVANAYTVAANSAATTLSVLSNDSIAPDTGETLSIPAATTPNQGGTLTINAGTSLRYTPRSGFSGTETCAYTASDGRGGTGSATVTITVTPPPNTPPLAANDSFSIQQNSTGNVLNVLGNDTDANGDALAITSRTTPSQGGTATISAGTIVYAPAANFSGTESFSYTISDGNGGTSSASVSISVAAAPNNVPVANNDSYSGILEDTAGNALNVRANDTDADGDTLTITSRTAPSQGGTATITSGSILYTPAANFSGTETFSYTVSDGKGGTDSASVSVSVSAVNDAPVAANDSYSGIPANSTGNVLGVSANDTDADGDTLTITSRTTPSQGGTATISAGTIVYAPAANFSGTETFSYTISDGKGGTSSASVSISVAAAPNNAPVASDDSFSGIQEDTTGHVLDVRANDTDADGDALTIISRTTPSQGGTASIASGSILYAPASNFSGTETFSYTVSDGKGGTDTASISVSVTAVNDAPVAGDDAYSAAADSSANALNVLSNDSDPETDPLSITDLGAASGGGTVSISANGLSYTPAAGFSGSETFTYTVSDGNGGTDTATVTITISINNTTPTATADAFTVPMNSAANPLVVCANDVDPDAGDSLSIASLGVANHGGSLSLASLTTVAYSPAANYVGPEVFTYTVKDSKGATASAQVTVTVKDMTPTTGPDRYKIRGPKRPRGEVKKSRLSVLKNDVSNSGTPLSLVGSIQDARAIHGLVELDGNDFLYTPAADYLGNEVFLYTVRDGLNQTATGEVTVEIVEDIGTSLCENFPAILVEMAELYADFGLKGNDVDSDGIPDDFMLEAMQIVDCYEQDTPLGIAAATAYQINLAAFDSEANALPLLDYREAIAALSTMNTAMQGALNQTLDLAGLTLGQTYEAVNCDDAGNCMPQPLAGVSLSDGFQAFDGDRGALEQPYSAGADIDDDGFSNSEEYDRVVAAGGSRTEFANAVTDPSLDGSTPAPSGDSNAGACFIATAAYGTPLAGQIDVFRTVRDREMLGNGIGASFVDTYYRLSPPVARLVADYPALASLVRALLWPMVAVTKAFIAAPALMLAGALALSAGMVTGLRRRRANT